jgi:hypothetical protein
LTVGDAAPLDAIDTGALIGARPTSDESRATQISLGSDRRAAETIPFGRCAAVRFARPSVWEGTKRADHTNASRFSDLRMLDQLVIDALFAATHQDDSDDSFRL